MLLHVQCHPLIRTCLISRPLSVEVAVSFQAGAPGGAAEEGRRREQSSDSGAESSDEDLGGSDLYSS